MARACSFIFRVKLEHAFFEPSFEPLASGLVHLQPYSSSNVDATFIKQHCSIDTTARYRQKKKHDAVLLPLTRRIDFHFESDQDYSYRNPICEYGHYLALLDLLLMI